MRTSSADFRAPVLVVATGGLSIPKIGATAQGYDLARQFGLKIIKTRPALVPLILPKKEQTQYSDLAGVSAQVVVSSDHQSFREQMLFTHRGPAAQPSSKFLPVLERGRPLRIDLAPGRDVTSAIRKAKTRNLSAARAAFLGVLPKRFAERWLDLHAPPHLDQRSIGLARTRSARVGSRPRRHRRLRESGSDRRRRRQRRTLHQNNGMPKSPRPIFHRRGRRRHWPSWRFQFSMGLGLRRGRGALSDGSRQGDHSAAAAVVRPSDTGEAPLQDKSPRQC